MSTLHRQPYKHHNMKWATLFLIISFLSCKTKGPACFIDATDILKGAPRKLISVKDSGYKISALYDEGWDRLEGGAYLFYPNEMLKSYTFYQSGVPVYSEIYDELGHLIQTKGSPMVYRIIYEIGQDSAYVVVCFFKPMKTYQQLNIKINNDAPADYTMGDDTLYSNMKSATFGINTSELNLLNMYTRIKYTDDCAKVEHVLSDSLSLVKDPHNGLIAAPGK